MLYLIIKKVTDHQNLINTVGWSDGRETFEGDGYDTMECTEKLFFI